MLFDAHTHLQDHRLTGCRAEVLRAASAGGVSAICVCGTSPDDWDAVATLHADTQTTLNIQRAYGVHPWFCDALPRDWRERLDALLQTQRQAVVGEIGLDGIRRGADRNLQRHVFKTQLELAIYHQRPVIVHGARCWGTLAEALTPYASRLAGIVLHAYAGATPLTRRFVALGAYFSFAGTICDPQARRVHEAAKDVPTDHLLIETDAPDLMPYGGTSAVCGQRLNQPANLPLIATALAQHRKMTVAEIGAITAANTRRVYGATNC